MERTFSVVIKGTQEELEDITAFEICEAVRKSLGELGVNVKEEGI